MKAAVNKVLGKKEKKGRTIYGVDAVLAPIV